MAFQKNYTPWNKGKHMSPEHKANHKEAMKSVVNAGQFKKGQKPWATGTKGLVKNPLKGKKMPEVWKAKLRKPKSVKRVITLEHRRQISERQKGIKSRFWLGGKTPFLCALRNSFEYKLWRSEVFKRDGYKCVECGYDKGKIIQADHIKPLSIIIRGNELKNLEEAIGCKELWDISNGRTLCIPCHKKTETYGGKQTSKNIKIYG